MKQTLLSLVIAMLSIVTFAQNNVGIGTATPDASAKLDISATDKGLLIPRLTLAQRSAIASPATGLLIYQSDSTAGFYYNAGTPATPNWKAMSSSGADSSNAWLLSGNAGTNLATNFIGTTDNMPLTFKVNNQRAGRIETFTSTPTEGMRGNTSLGYQTLQSIP